MFNFYQNIVADIAEFITKVKNNSLLFISNSSFEVDDEYVKKISDRFKSFVQLKAINMFDIKKVKKNV